MSFSDIEHKIIRLLLIVLLLITCAKIIMAEIASFIH